MTLWGLYHPIQPIQLRSPHQKNLPLTGWITLDTNVFFIETKIEIDCKYCWLTVVNSLRQYGLVFGIPNLAAFITAPLFGIYGQAIDPSAMCLIGAFMQGICGILFAFLGRLDNLAAFLGLSYLLRLVSL